MKLIEIIYIELNSSKTYCNTEYLREEFLSKIKLNGEKIEEFNALNKKLTSFLITYSHISTLLYFEDSYYKKKIYVTEKEPTLIKHLLINKKNYSVTQKEYTDYIINNIDKVIEEKIEANLYKIKADISFVIYQNKSSEGFLDKDGKCSALNKAILFFESTSAEKFCKLRNIDNYKVFQISLKTFKESCNYNCQSGDLLNILLSNQEKEILEQQNLVIEIELLNKKIKKYETILQENNLLSINQEQFSKKINKI